MDQFKCSNENSVPVYDGEEVFSGVSCRWSADKYVIICFFTNVQVDLLNSRTALLRYFCVYVRFCEAALNKNLIN